MYVKVHLYLSLFFQCLPDCHPRIVVIGALGRCGKGALDMAYKVGIPRYTGMSPVMNSLHSVY